MDQGANDPKAIGYVAREITEEQVAESAPRVRWNQVERYEELYRVISAHIEAAVEIGRPVDPRYLELGIRVLKEEANLYRLSKPTPPSEDEDDGNGAVDRAAVVEASLKEIGTRMATMAQAQAPVERDQAPEAG